LEKEWAVTTEETKNKMTTMESQNKITLSTGLVDEEINYQAEDKWTVEYFVSHQIERIQLIINNRKTWVLGYILKARWKGYEPEDDTMDPIHMVARYHKTALIGYLKQVQDKGLFTCIAQILQGHLQQNSKTRFCI
jgi:hypothetical protein